MHLGGMHCVAQVVEEEFKQTAAKLGVTGAEADALAHQWASPEATGVHPSGVQMTGPEAFNDSAHSHAHTPHHYGRDALTILPCCVSCQQYIVGCTLIPGLLCLSASPCVWLSVCAYKHAHILPCKFSRLA